MRFLADILIAMLSMSTELLWEAFGEWIFGNFACKFSTYVQCLLFISTSSILMRQVLPSLINEAATAAFSEWALAVGSTSYVFTSILNVLQYELGPLRGYLQAVERLLPQSGTVPAYHLPVVVPRCRLGSSSALHFRPGNDSLFFFERVIITG